jgi:hydroxypyruvate isomerase
MKFSVMEWSSRPQQDAPADYYRRLREIGMEAVELPALESAAAVRQAGMAALNIAAPGRPDGLCNRSYHDRLIPQIKKQIEDAQARGIQQVIVFSGDAQGVDEDEGLRNCVAGLKPCVALAEKLKVQLLFEMFNTHDHPGYLAVSSRFGFELAKAISSPRLKLLYDIYHMARMGEDPLRDLKTGLEYVGHLHVAGSPRRDFPGPEQEIRYPAIVKEVVARGYDGYWGLEYLPSGDAYRSLAEAMALLRSYA